MRTSEVKSAKVCPTHNVNFPNEPVERPIAEFASGGKHTYCRRCMAIRQRAYNDSKKASGEPRHTPTKVKLTTGRTITDSPPRRMKFKAPEGLSTSPLGLEPTLDMPFIITAQPGVVYAFKSYWLLGDNAAILGCDWNKRGTWRTEMNVFRLSEIHAATPTELEALGIHVDEVPLRDPTLPPEIITPEEQLALENLAIEPEDRTTIEEEVEVES